MLGARTSRPHSVRNDIARKSFPFFRASRSVRMGRPRSQLSDEFLLERFLQA